MKMVALVLAVFACVSASPLIAQQPVKPEAQAAFDTARKLPFGDEQAIKLYQKAIAIDPDFVEAHRYYLMAYPTYAGIKAGGTEEEKGAAGKKGRDEMIAQYTKLAAEHPGDAVYPFALGLMDEYQDPEKSVEYYKKALAVDPNFGPAYDMLGIASEAQGDLKQALAYEKKGHEAWPNDRTIWRHYLGEYAALPDQADIDKAIEIARQLAAKFPEEGVSMLSYATGRLIDPAKRQALYEQIRADYPKQSGGYALTPLFSLYIATDPQKALKLADDMRKGTAAPGEKADAPTKLWDPYYVYAKAVVDGNALIAQGKGAEASALLEKAKAPSLSDVHPLELARANALAAQGKTHEAYASLEQDFAVKPSRETYPTLLELGKKLGKGQHDIDAGVQAARIRQSKAGTPFTLTDYATGKQVSLSDYKGRVVLVNFWYPQCGPCRGEFPYLQMTLDKYKDRGFAILAINGRPEEDSWVMPLIKGWGLDFTPLKGTPEVVKAYKVLGFPSNFLYGADGRIYPMPRQVRAETLGEFDLQLEGLMKQAAGIATKQIASVPAAPASAR